MAVFMDALMYSPINQWLFYKLSLLAEVASDSCQWLHNLSQKNNHLYLEFFKDSFFFHFGFDIHFQTYMLVIHHFRFLKDSPLSFTVFFMGKGGLILVSYSAVNFFLLLLIY